MARTFILIGIFFITIGVITYIIGKIPGVGRLPGDIVIENDKYKFYFPIVTCLLISLVMSLILYFLNQR